MAVGVIRQIASGQHLQITIPSGNYPWPTIRVLNPNDGIAYIRQNADVPDIGFGSWDYKVPSQSYGLLPGSGEGWQSVGIYYLDQSGANRPGEISIYLTQQNATEPMFQSIGRALVALSTSVDIASGSQPSNPPAGYGRLWIDGGGHLNVLQPSGTNYITLDSTNFSTYVQPLINSSISSQVPGIVGGVSLGGDLYGTVANGHVGLANGSPIYARWSGDSNLHGILVLTTNDTWLINAGGGQIRFINQAASAELGHFDNSGNLVVTGAISTAGTITGNDFHTSRGNDTGVIYLGNSGSHYLYFDGTNWNLYGGSLYLQGGNFGVLGGSQDVTCGSVSITQGGNQVIYWRDGSHYLQYAPAGDTNTLYWTHTLQLGLNLGLGQGIVNGYRQELPNTAGKPGQILANAFATYSSVEHARKFNLPIIEVQDPITKLHGVTPYYYKHASIKEDGQPVLLDTGEIESSYLYGFSAQDMHMIIPEVVGQSDTGVPVAITYDRLVPVLWSAVQNIEKRLLALEPK